MAISDQALDASRQGAPLRPEGEVQTASMTGDVVKAFLQLMRKAPKGASEAPGMRAVPTPDEERMLRPEIDAYRQRQEQAAPDMLSPAGQQRFEEGGFSAEQSLSTRPETAVDQAQQAINEMGQMVDQTRANLRYVDPNTGELRAGSSDRGAASEVDAADLQRALERERVEGFVSGGDSGIDFNFDRLETGDDVKALFDHVSELHQAPINDAKRGIITNPETLDDAERLLADELGFTRSLLARRKGGMLNAAQMTAARKLMVRSGERLLDMANQIKANKANNVIDKELMVRFRRQMVIHSGIQMQTKAAQTEIARALQAFNIPAGASADMRARVLDDILDITAGDASTARGVLDGGVSEVERIAEGMIDVYNTGGGSALHKYAAAVGQRGSKAFYEAYINGLLGWTKTHIKNFVATPMFMGWQLTEELAAGVYGSLERGAMRAVGREAAEGVYMGQVFARMFGMSSALRDAWVTAARTFSTEMPTSALNKVEAGQFRAISAESLGVDALQSPNLAVFVDRLGKAIRIPGRALMAADDFWRVIGMRGELYAEAWNNGMKAKNMGKTLEEASDDFAMTLLDPRSMADQLDAAASYSTLTTELGKVGEFARAFQRIPVVGKLLMPFVKAPTNSIIRVIERLHPFHKGLFSNPETRQKAVGRMMVTWGAMYQMHQFAVNGRVTGAMPKDEKQRRMLPPGWQPYSLVFKGDNWPQDQDGSDLPIFDPVTGAPNGPLTYISYAGLEPVGAILGIAATTAERMRRSNNPEASLDLVANAVGAAFNYVQDMPMLKALADITKAIEYGNSSYVIRSPIGGMMPYSSAVRAVEGAVDPVRRKPSKEYEYYTLEGVKNPSIVPFVNNEPRYDLVGVVKTAGENSLRSALAEYKSIVSDRPLYGGADDETSGIQYDVMGVAKDNNVRFDINPTRAMWNLVMPFSVSSADQLTTEMREHIRLGGPLSFSKDKLEGIKLTEAMQSQWTRAAKNEVEIISAATGTAMKFRPALKALVSSMVYLSSNDEEKKNQIQNLEEEFYKAAIPLLVSQNPELGQVLKDKETLKLIGR